MRRSVVSLILVALLTGCSGSVASPNAVLPSGAAQAMPSPATHASSNPRAASSPPADPEANPSSTAHVSTRGLTVAPVLAGARRVCRSGNPLANVYHPYRLQVVAACSTVSGVVETVRHEDDGDYHIDLALDPAYRHMLDAANGTYQHGWLVLEIVPADQPGCTVGLPPRPASGTYDYGICTGADETPPSVGQHLWVTGPYVIDLWHDWTEIHPVWSMSRIQPLASTPTAASGTSTTTRTTTGATAVMLRCSASMSDSTPTQYSTTTVTVRTAAGAQVSATAHYRTTATTHTGSADSSGIAQIPFRIGRATIGYAVTVGVSVTAGSTTATCATSFTPQG